MLVVHHAQQVPEGNDYRSGHELGSALDSEYQARVAATWSANKLMVLSPRSMGHYRAKLAKPVDAANNQDDHVV